MVGVQLQLRQPEADMEVMFDDIMEPTAMVMVGDNFNLKILRG